MGPSGHVLLKTENIIQVATIESHHIKMDWMYDIQGWGKMKEDSRYSPYDNMDYFDRTRDGGKKGKKIHA